MSEPDAESVDGEQHDNQTYYVGVEHTDTLTGAPDLAQVQVVASSEKEAKELASHRGEWPEPEFYDEEDVEARTYE